MPVEFLHPAWLLALAVAVPVVAVWRSWPTPFGKARRATALGVRLAIVLLLVLALAGPELSYRASGQTLVLAVDRSASVASAQR